MKKILTKITAILVMMSVVLSVMPVTYAQAATEKTDDHIYKLWYDEQASDESADGVVNPTYNEASTSGWENEQLPIGNGYMGAAIFGRTDRERVQLSDKTLHTTDKGLMNFAETYIYFNHEESAVSNYYRDLNINDALASVSYDYNGVTYTREYLTSYPDNVLAIKLTASGSGNLNFSLEPMIPFLASETSTADGTRTTTCERTGTVVADETTNDLITLSGHLTGFEIDYEAQYKIVPTGGTMTASNTVTDGVADKGKITVSGADSAIIYVALDTNYKLSSDTFIKYDSVKLSGNPHPHDAVTARIAAAVTKGYDAIKEDHIADVSEYFDRVKLNLTTEVPDVTTDVLLANYKNGDEHPYLEELIYQYGRYMLIASSRENSLPAHLTGAWNAYDYPICLAGYWHNINLQMNYWGVFSSNLTEMFESYVNMYKAFLPDVSADASDYIKTAHPDNWDSSGNNGWGASTRVTPYSAYATRPSGIDGAGTGAMAADLLWDYYEFTGDETILEEVAYPAISGSANYMSRQMESLDAYPGLLLIPTSGSPENHVPEINADGAAFAQGWAYSNYLDTLKGAELLGIDDSDTVVSRINDQIDKIDPIQIGYSGQIKEFREETVYGEYGEWNHRHISHLIGAFPADFINSSTPAWQDAVNVAIEKRGTSSPSDWSWEFAHRMNVCARTGDGNTAYDKFQLYINRRTKNNLWANGAFQIDGNLGIIAGVDEMLLQSHEGIIKPLAAMPDAWEDGSYDGLVARGNFVVGATWKDAQAEEIRITSRNGGECKVEYKNVANATLKDSDGNTVSFTADGDVITFNTEVGKSYVLTSIPAHDNVAKPASIAVEYTEGSDASITWEAVSGASTYNVYRATNSSATYDVVATGVTDTSYTMDNVAGENQYTYAVTALDADGDESPRAVCTTIAAITPASATGTYLDDTTLQIEAEKSSTATGYRVYADGELVMESPYCVIVLENADSSKTYTVRAVIDELVGAEVAVESTDSTVSKKALYDEVVRADGIDLSQYDETFATSITNEKNKAVAVLEATATEDEVAAAAAELKDVLDNIDMIVALGKITSSNTRIIPMDKTLAVLSNPNEASYKISSDALISALTITDGYTLSYVDDNKEANATSHVISGYVKAVKDGQDDVYIPIVKKGAVIDNTLQDNDVENGTSNATYSYTGGIGGKADTEMSATFSVGATASRYSPRVIVGSVTATDADALQKIPYTVKFKVYADGNATAGVNYRWRDANDAYRLFRWEPDGTFKYNVNGTLVEGGTLAREQWHDVAIVYCSQLNKYQLYIDNELMEGYSGSPAGNYYCALLLLLEDGSTNGNVAFSDLEAYYGYYYPPFKPTPEHLLLTMTSSNSYVQVGSSSIAVFSHPSNETYQIGSDTVVSALSPDTGWTLKYTNTSKVETTVSHVKSGFIKASHADYQDVYIPITYKGAVIDNDFSNNAASYKGTTKATYTYADGVATFTAGATAIDGYTYAGIGNSSTSADAISQIPYTIGFKMKVTGDAIGVVNYRWDGDNYNIIRVNGDGSYTHMNNANTQVAGGTLASGEWHDIKIVYDAPVNRYQLWVNGECKASDIGTIPTGYYSKIVFAIASGSQNGTVEFKDFDTNYGYYYQPFTPTASYLLSTMLSDNDRVDVGGDAVAVYSNPLNTSYQVSSAALISALTIEDGWSMEFVNANKEAATVDHVKEGYIKATHADYDAVYIPVTYKGAVIDNDFSNNAASYKGTTKATYTYADGVATFTAGATAIDGYSYTGIGNGAGNADAIEKLPYTVKFKMKTAGNAIGTVNWRWEGDGFEILRVEADGTFKYRGASGLVSGGAFAKDIWHDVALVYDHTLNNYQIWIDGECKVTATANAPTNYFAKIVFAIATGSANGTVSFKDFDTYYGYHYESESVDTTTGELAMKYDDHIEVDGTIVIDSGNSIVEVDDEGKLHAIGVGETTIKIGDQMVNVTVSKAKLNVVLIAGQSNAAGVHGNRNTDAVSPEVGYGYYWNGTNMTDLRTHISSIETSIGFYPALAYEWNELTGEKVYIIHHTYSGNPLSKWASYTDGTLNTGTTATVQTIENALAAIDTSKFEIERTGYYWLQGETDAFINATTETTMYPTAAQYQTAFTAVHNAFTEALGEGSYGAIMSCRTRNDITSYANIEFCGMRVAQQDMANQNEDIFMASVITDEWNSAKTINFTAESGMTISATTSELGANNIHYSQKGYNVLGLDAADNMFTALTEDVALTDIAVISHDGKNVYEDNSTIDVADNMRYIGIYNTAESKMAQIVARPLPISYDSTSLTFAVKDSEGNAVDGVIDNRGYIDTTKVTEDLTLTVACGGMTKTFTLVNSAYIPSTEDVMESMTSSNDRVIVGADTITVFSHPSNTSYQLSSASVIAALTVADGWSLAYADDNKNVTTTDSVTGGYIKATHSQYGDTYIPITAKGDDIANNIGTTATNYGNASTAATYSYADGVVTFTAGETKLTGYKLTGIGAGTGNAGAILQLPYTMKFKMKTTGDAIGVVNMRNESDSQNLVRFNADGTLQYRGTASNMLDSGRIAKDTWHDVVLVYDQPANKYQIWVDGKCLIENSGSVAGKASNHYSSKIVFAIATGSANGTVEFKDFEGYYGYYTVVEDVEEVVVPDDMTMTHLATSEVYEKDGVEYVFVAVTTPSAADLSLYNTFVCTDGETTKGIALTDIVTTTVTGESEIAIIVKNVLNVNADNFKAAITATEIDEMD